MTQKGFEDYLYALFGQKTGTAKSYITAIHIIDEMFEYNDVFALKGKSVTSIEDTELLTRIADFVSDQQSLFKKGEVSIFRNVNTRQNSYPGKGFCSAAIKQLLQYHKYDIEEKKASEIVSSHTKGSAISNQLITLFDIDKKGLDKEVPAKVRLGQSYFRKMVLANYANKCCVSGLNIPQLLRASHIVSWAENVKHRMDPENGLCLSATYDAAFDKHLISFDDDYRMIVSKEIKDYYTNEVANEYFGKYEGKSIILPERFMPSKKLLEKHRNLMVE